MEGRHTKTIRGKIGYFFLLCMVFIVAVTSVYYKNLFSLRKKLVDVENFDDFLNDVIELRRYEKNFIYYRDSESLKRTESYIFKIETDSKEILRRLDGDTRNVDYRRFQQNLRDYKAILQKAMFLIETDNGDAQIENLRSKGRSLVYYAQRLIDTERQHIRKALDRTLTVIPLAFCGILLVFVIVIFQMLNKEILKPLHLVEQATIAVAKQTFTPIAFQEGRQDEISQLILAFNNMVQELEDRQNQLLQSRKLASIGTFTSGIAHELNNPLNNIFLTAETLQMGYETMSREELKEMIEDILVQADEASQVVKNLLNFSRSERTHLQLLNIGQVINDALKLINNQLVISNIQLKLDIAKDLPLIKGKSKDLQQVFINMFLNAINAMPNRGTISIKADKISESYIKVDLSDTGTGIKPQDLEHIFDPFYTTKEVGSGTGLGLSLSYGIIRTHNGRIEVKSELNKGTTFSIFLPIPQETSFTDENKNSSHR